MTSSYATQPSLIHPMPACPAVRARVQPIPDRLIFMAGDFLGGPQAAAPQHHQKRPGHFVHRGLQLGHRRAGGRPKGAAAVVAAPLMVAVAAAIADGPLTATMAADFPP